MLKNVTLSERNQDNKEYIIWFYLIETLGKTNLATLYGFI